ncbi:MAG: DSD1 family PLP-dependent enzyme [Alphaproteobacteria bacterium]|nr:DSD1 family PLP-dependent enzyme [Alphaproteobacteria bacterium]
MSEVAKSEAAKSEAAKSEAERLHRHLIGQQGSRRSLNTPALVLDLDMLDRNIAEMAAFAAAHNVKLRPHSKTHKSADIARRQIASGALGVCCAKLGEAEALADSGIESLHITSPVVTPQAIDRLIELNGKVSDLMVVVDHPANVEALAAAAGNAGKPLTVIVDIDPGMHRTGVASPDGVVELVRKVTQQKSLKYAGVQFYCGRHQHIVDFAERKAAIEERTEYLKGILAKLETAGLKPGIVTGSGTGTHYIDGKLGVFTELQVGSYIFMDHDYNVCDLRGLDRPTFEQALQIAARVVSANTPGLATVDAGLKAMATEKGPPPILKGAPEGSTTRFMGDEHLAVVPPEGQPAPAHGEQVILVPPHCDPTVNMYESYHVVKGDTLVDIWPVTARGRSR